MKQRLLISLLAAGLLLTGCANETAFRPSGVAGASQQDLPFQVSGRISVNMDGKGSVGQFDWTHLPGHDELSVNSPLGNTVAQLQRDATGVSLVAGGKHWQAVDVEQLTGQVLGWTLPLGNLVWWIRGRPAPDAPYQFAADGSLAQQGWTIRFVSDADTPSPYPKRIEMQRDRLTLRVLPQNWH